MAYWEEVKDASRYYVHLEIGHGNNDEMEYQEIKLVECDRHTKTFSFQGLSKINRTYPNYLDMTNKGYETGLNYYIYVEAENKDGNIIDKSEKVMQKVVTFRDGYCVK